MNYLRMNWQIGQTNVEKCAHCDASEQILGKTQVANQFFAIAQEREANDQKDLKKISKKLIN